MTAHGGKLRWGAGLNGGSAFDNGRTAEHRSVRLKALKQGLEIRDQGDGLMLALWAYGDLVPLPPQNGPRLRLSSKSDPLACLTTDDAVVIARLRRLAPGLAKKRRRWPVAAVGLLLLCLLAMVRMVPAVWQLALGHGIGEPAATYGGECRSAAGDAALATLLRRLTEPNRLSFAASVQVRNSPAINALALPDGRIVLLNGLLQEVEGPDELAAVLAHELSHLALRQVSLPYGSAAEGEVEDMTIQLLEKADISLQAMGNLFRRLDRRDRPHGRAAEFLADHPATDARAIRPIIQPFVRPALTAEAWNSLRAICD